MVVSKMGNQIHLISGGVVKVIYFILAPCVPNFRFLKDCGLCGVARDLIANYYKDLRIRFTTKDCTTEWQKVEKGIITGFT